MYLSQDPIRLLGGNPNLYAYVKNTNAWIDIFGLDCKVKVTAGDGVTHDIVATIKKSDFPETAQHIEDAIKKGHPDIVTVDRLNAAAQRTKSLKGIPTKKGFDRDEWPMAMFKEGGSGASVRYINPSDNRGAGSAVGSALSDYPNDTRVLIKIID
ncbi:NucA/NucB deoxyribonuclease domain-containing protein [Flavobacterium covae]|nr:NucA/NucB deoxyribonuclease domain-containing protein [Flavobacterium covae]